MCPYWVTRKNFCKVMASLMLGEPTGEMLDTGEVKLSPGSMEQGLSKGR